MSDATEPRGLPGLVGNDHTGLTVPDLDAALDFFVGVLGCQHGYTFGPIADDQGTFMTEALGVHPRARIKRCALIRIGHGSNLELFEYDAPDQRRLDQKNSDIGAFHIAFYVRDIDAAKAYLDSQGVETRLGPIPIAAGPNAGQSILYFQAPWGLQLEAISYPDGMAYEKDSAVTLWDPRKPAL
ncbi:catechol 2,3-dioxygenase-like lactoylglutathione lyase family enzyme [Kaistia dalseonensis]|uniref:Catechol 2,3-dioxygenase-like lactoylglutathione lyase family enzyme n=1 Tax=Kaistia dalseonensis TaxID=410840 RepID=A0ABU0H9V0_9HYPH|nr:catechol 2,3-dioxygenase-like lactoylglutathione lyase family enzyme [Kaistia dalseonensis]